MLTHHVTGNSHVSPCGFEDTAGRHLLWKQGHTDGVGGFGRFGGGQRSASLQPRLLVSVAAAGAARTPGSEVSRRLLPRLCWGVEFIIKSSQSAVRPHTPQDDTAAP